MIFQSRFNNHSFVVQPTTKTYYPGQGWDINPGLAAEFDKRTRLFDSVAAQEKNQWTDEQRIRVEDWLLKCKAFGKDIFMAPGELQKLDESTIAKMRVKPKSKVRRCQDVRIVDGEVVQCEAEATVGREHCERHDPKAQRIVKGAVEQK